MFGISFSELFIIAVVALLVIGPEKLPKVARTVGALTGRVQRYAAQVKEEVNREFRFEELQKLQEEIKQAVISTKQNVEQQVADVENSITSSSENNPVQNQETIEKKAITRKPRAKPTKTVADDLEKPPKRVTKTSSASKSESSPTAKSAPKIPVGKLEG